MKGLSRFILYQKSIVEQDDSKSCLAKYYPLIDYWKEVKVALELPPPSPAMTLISKFWPRTQVQVTLNDIFNGNGNIKDEFGVQDCCIGLLGGSARDPRFVLLKTAVRGSCSFSVQERRNIQNLCGLRLPCATQGFLQLTSTTSIYTFSISCPSLRTQMC